MTKDIRKLHAQILEQQGEVTFYDGDLYEIYESSNGGYMVDVYEVSEVGLLVGVPESKVLTEVDGGLCTGSALDAVEFFMIDDISKFRE